MTTVATLYVSPNGVYVGRDSVDLWDAKRDAREYHGDNPVVAHPPCDRWCALAQLNERRYGYRVGADDGCFAAALSSLIRCGGVLEHPAETKAWKAFGLPVPRRAGGWLWWPPFYVCEVWQSAYRHKARKRTWLLYVGDQPPFPLDWTHDPGTHQIGHDGKSRKPVLWGDAASATPPDFADTLLALARHAIRRPTPMTALTTKAAQTEAALATVNTDPVLAAFKAHADAFHNWADAFGELGGPDALATATQAVKDAKTYIANIETHRHNIVDNPTQYVARWNAAVKLTRDPLEEAIEKLQAAMGRYAAAQQRAADTAMLTATNALEAGDNAGAASALATYNAHTDVVEGKLSTDLDVVVINASIVPEEWTKRVVDIDKLKAARLANPKLVVMGVMFNERSKLTVSKPRKEKANGRSKKPTQAE